MLEFPGTMESYIRDFPDYKKKNIDIYCDYVDSKSLRRIYNNPVSLAYSLLSG